MLTEQGYFKRRPRNTEGFVKPNTKIERYADMKQAIVDESEPFKMVAGGAIISPSSFFLFSLPFWHSHCRSRFQEAYTPDQLHLYKIWAIRDVTVGMYVAIKYEGEWHRGRVLAADWRAKRPFLIRLIDFGEKLLATLSHIYYLADACGEEPEAAVECRLVVSRRTGPIPRPGTIRPSWEKVQRSAFRKLMFDRVVEVTVLNKPVNEYGETVWHVTLKTVGCSGRETLFKFTPLLSGQIEQEVDSALEDCMKTTYD